MQQISNDHAKAIAGRSHANARVAHDRYETRPILAFLLTAIAFIVGTIVFECAATGAEFPNLDPEDRNTKPPAISVNWGQALEEDETTVCLSVSPLEGLFRLERYNKVQSSLDAIIETESIKLALIESTKVIQPAPANLRVDEEAIAMDPVVHSMPLANSEFRQAYAELEDQRGAIGYSERQRVREAYNDATQSDLPGLIRLTAHEGLDSFPPLYVEDLPPAAVASSAKRVRKPKSKKESRTKSVAPESVATDRGSDKPLVRPASARSTSLAVQPESNTSIRQLINDAAAEINSRQRPLAMADATVIKSKPISLPVSPSPTVDAIAPSSPSDQRLEAAVVITTAPVQHTVNEPEPETAATTEPSMVQQSRSAAPNTVATDAIARNTPEDTEAGLALPTESQLGREAIHQPIRQPEERIAAAWPFKQQVVETKQSGVSLSVDNADVRTVFEMLARGYGMNILVSPDVVGTVTANVEGLTPEQTLNGVLKMCDLRAQVDDEMIYIYPPDKLPSDARSLRLFPLDFARAEILEPVVQGLLTPIGNAYTTKIDGEDNLKTRETIVVVDTPESLARIESYITQADRPPRQVMIEARILEIELTDAIKHGVDIGAALGGDLSVGAIGLADPSTTGPLFFTSIDGSRVDALMDLLETTTDAKTLASPKVMVVNGQNAKIQVGQQLGFTVATVTQTSTIQDVQFLDTGVVLSVQPTISRDNKILMSVKPEVSNGQINPDTLLPEEETRELETSVLLNDHQGVVIGGLIQENDRTVIRKLPWLGDVKHVGKLFQHREAVRSRSEIIVALVPHIVNLDEVGGHEFCVEEKRQIELERATTPLLYGPLQRTCRPWEARMPDSAGETKHMDVNKINRMIP